MGCVSGKRRNANDVSVGVGVGTWGYSAKEVMDEGDRRGVLTKISF